MKMGSIRLLFIGFVGLFFFILEGSILPRWINLSYLSPHVTLLLGIALIYPAEKKISQNQSLDVPLWTVIVFSIFMGYLEDLQSLSPKGLFSFIFLLIFSILFLLKKYLLSPKGWFLIVLLGGVDLFYQLIIPLLSSWLIPKFYLQHLTINFQALGTTLLSAIPILWLFRKLDRMLLEKQSGKGSL